MQSAGKVILITGSTDGVSRMVAERLGAGGAMVLVHGRDEARGAAVVEEIKREGGDAAFYRADFSSLAAVRSLAEAVRRDHGRIDVLINSAGIGSGGPHGQREVSADGHELRFAVNYLSGYLLTRLLLPVLKASEPSRIVNVASLGQQPLEFDDVMLTRDYSGWRAYCQSKLAQILFTIDLAEELKDTRVTANCLHPATYMNTTMVRQSGATPMSSVEEGAQAILNLVQGNGLGSGKFFNGLKPARANEQAYDPDARRRLRELSAELAGI